MREKFFHHPKLLPTVLLIVAIIVSMVLAPYVSTPEFHQTTLHTVQQNKVQATGLAGLVTVASVAVSALPDDTASSLANELSDLSTPLLLIVCVLYFEQFMLTSLWYLVFMVLLPAGLALLVAYLWTERRAYTIIATKILLIALVCALIIPMSALLTRMIEETFTASIGTTFSQVDQIKEAFSGLTGNEDGASILSFFSSLASGIMSIIDYIMSMLGLLIDAVAILLITSVVIPVITALLFVWVIKSIISGNMENLHDTAMDILKRVPTKPLKRLEKPDKAA